MASILIVVFGVYTYDYIPRELMFAYGFLIAVLSHLIRVKSMPKHDEFIIRLEKLRDMTIKIDDERMLYKVMLGTIAGIVFSNIPNDKKVEQIKEVVIELFDEKGEERNDQME